MLNPSTPSRGQKHLTDRTQLFLAIKPHRAAVLWLALLSSSSVVVEILLIGIIGALSSRALAATGSLPFVGRLSNSQLILFALVCALTKLVLDLTYARMFASFLYRYESRLRRQIALLQANCSWATIEDSETGSLHALLWTSVHRSREGVTQFIVIISSLTSLTLMLAATVIAARLMIVPVVIGLSIFGLAFQPLIRATREASGRLRIAYSRYSRELNESITMSREARVLGIQDRIASTLAESGDAAAEAVSKQSFYSSLLSQGYSNALYVAIIVALGVIVGAGLSNPASMAATALLLYRSMGYGRGLQSALQSIAASAPFVADVNRWLAELEAASEVIPHATMIEGFKHLEFRSAELVYPNGHTGVTDLSITISPGESIALVGRSGSGKSSLVSLLLALRENTDGTVLINGLPLDQVDRRSWRSHLAFVPQESVLFETSILENVRCWRDISDKRVREALRQANIYEEVMGMEAGLETDAGEGGRRLSGGQRQRICLARALAGDPDLLILDEPTSALDPQSERAVKDSLEQLKGKLTMVIIAHRMTTISMCERVLVLEAGRLRHDGPPDLVASQSDYFARALELSDGG